MSSSTIKYLADRPHGLLASLTGAISATAACVLFVVLAAPTSIVLAGSALAAIGGVCAGAFADSKLGLTRKLYLERLEQLEQDWRARNVGLADALTSFALCSFEIAASRPLSGPSGLVRRSPKEECWVIQHVLPHVQETIEERLPDASLKDWFAQVQKLASAYTAVNDERSWLARGLGGPDPIKVVQRWRPPLLRGAEVPRTSEERLLSAPGVNTLAMEVPVSEEGLLKRTQSRTVK
jgi:hypothetical protein